MTNTRHKRQRQRLATLALTPSRLVGLLEQAYEAAELTLPDGYPSGGGEPVSGGDTSNPTLAAVIQREGVLDTRTRDGEPVSVGLSAVDTSLAVIEAAYREIHNELSSIVARLHRGHEQQRTNMDDCRACGQVVANTPNDRIVSGYCRTCYQAWRRLNQPDRPAFERARAQAATAGDSSRIVATDRDDTIDVTVLGVTRTLSGHLASELRALQSNGTLTDDDIRRLHATAS